MAHIIGSRIAPRRRAPDASAEDALIEALSDSSFAIEPGREEERDRIIAELRSRKSGFAK